MMWTKKDTVHYFQTVARFFLEQRGAPFFLSSQEIEIIAGWERTGIPVQTVLQGIRDSFESRKKRSGRRGRVMSLAFCHPFVLKALEAYKERKVGDNRKPTTKRDKREELRRTISLFLESCPKEIQEVKQFYSRALNLSPQGIEEQMLETFEQEVETLLIQKASAEEKKRIREDVISEFGSSDKNELSRIMDLKLAKYMREKYKVPYLSLFYY